MLQTDRCEAAVTVNDILYNGLIDVTELLLCFASLPNGERWIVVGNTPVPYRRCNSVSSVQFRLSNAHTTKVISGKILSQCRLHVFKQKRFQFTLENVKESVIS